MIKIEFDDQSINVPNSWKDIKLSDYEKWFMLTPETPPEHVLYVAKICNIDPRILLESPKQLFDIVCKSIEFVHNTNFEAVNEIQIDNVKYSISFSDKLTLAEWVDVESILEGDSPTKLSELLATLCRPIGEKYNVDTIEKRKEIFKELTCDKVLPLVAFFLNKRKELDKTLNHCLTVVDQAKQFLRDIETFVLNGDGIKQLPIWQRIRYIYLMRLLKKRLLKFSDSSYTE